MKYLKETGKIVLGLTLLTGSLYMTYLGDKEEIERQYSSQTLLESICGNLETNSIENFIKQD